MSADVSRDQLALIRIEGMHCHKCEHAIRKALTRHPGVHEVRLGCDAAPGTIGCGRLKLKRLLAARTANTLAYVFRRGLHLGFAMRTARCDLREHHDAPSVLQQRADWCVVLENGGRPAIECA